MSGRFSFRQRSFQAAKSARSVCVLALLLFVLHGCGSSKSSLPVISGETMGTQYRVTLGQTDLPAERIEQIRDVLETELVAFNSIFSTYEPASDISRFNDAAAGVPVAVDASLIDCWKQAKEIAELSDGAFDPTVGPLVNRWQFGPGRNQLKPPSEHEVEELLGRVGYANVDVALSEINDAPSEAVGLVKSVDGVQLDLSAIAKGRGVDRLCRVLEEQGVTSYLVDIGGELRASGRKPDGQPWRVAVRDPVEPFNAQKQSPALPLENASIATSGDYFNFHEVDGIRYSHTIDPRTGRPVTHDLASVTVIACDCETADAYATTLMVLGPDDGYSWAADHKIAAMLIRHEGAARLSPAYGDWLRTGELPCQE